MPRQPLDEGMLDYIINDAVDDFQDTIDGVKELARIFRMKSLNTSSGSLVNTRPMSETLRGRCRRSLRVMLYTISLE